MPFSGSSTQSPRLAAAVVALAYLAAGLIWIGFSDEFGNILFTGVAAQRFQTYKGAAFVVATSALIFTLLHRRYRRSAATMASTFAMPLGLALAGVVFVTAAPMLVLLGYNITSDLRESVARAERLVAATAEDTAHDVLAHFEERQRVIGMLAEQPAVAGRDRMGCESFLAVILGLYRHMRAIGVYDTNEVPICTAGNTALIDRAHHAETHAAGPVFGRPFRPSSEPGWLFGITYPVHATDGSPRSVVHIVVSPKSLAPVVESPLPDGGSVTLVQSDGFILARYPDSDMVGTRVRDLAAFDQMKQANGFTRATGRDGIERHYAVRKVQGMDLFVVAGVAVESIYAPVRSSALRYAGVSLVVVLIAGFFIARIVGGINGPMQAIAHAAQRVADGDFSERVPEAGPLEFRRVAARFNDMLHRLPLLERELRESEERHRTLLEKLSRNIPGMLFQFRVGPDGKATMPFASDGIFSMFETSPDAARAGVESVLARVHPDDRAYVAAQTEESMRSLANFSVEYRVVLPVRGLRCYLTYSQPEKMEDGSVMWYGCTVDVTQLKAAERELKKLNEGLEARVQSRTNELAAANEALESFSYSIAHDLRAPLAAISGFTKALIADPRGDRAAHLANRIVANAAKMEEMIQGLLAIAGVGRAALDERPLDVDRLILNVLQDFDLPENMNLDIQPLPQVVADSNTMRQVWVNLVGNAVKFTSKVPQPRFAIGCVRSASELEFFVADNGAGFDESQAQRMFGVFERMHSGAEFPGTGVGLPIVKRIVERHGGRIWAQGRPGQGATFRFTLPIARLVS